MTKKYGKYLLVLLVLMFTLGGCEKAKPEEKEKVEIKDITIYEQLEVKDEPLEKKEADTVEEGIADWASAFLIVNSDQKDKKVTERVLYENITNEKQRKELKKDRDAFYKNSKVSVEEVRAEVTESNKAYLKEREVGVVKCKVTATGKRNEKKFEKTYTMELVVDFKADVVSVYEVKSINVK